MKGDDGDRHHRRHEVTRHHVGELLNRRTAALGLGHHLHDLREHRIRADALGFDHQAARAVHRGADDAVAGAFLHRDGLAGDHRLVDAAVAFGYHAVHRHLSPRDAPAGDRQRAHAPGGRLPRCRRR